MKILHISTGNTGGAGLASERLHLGLRAIGVESKMLVLRKRGDSEEVHRYRQVSHTQLAFVDSGLSLLSAVNKRLGLPLSRAQRYRNRLNRLKRGSKPAPFFTLPFSDFDVASHPLVREADVIHLHWIADFIDFPTFFRKVKKPVFWTLRDENAFLGGFHYAMELDKANSGYRALDMELADAKGRFLSDASRLSFIFLSQMMTRQFDNHPMTAGRRNFTIPNLVNPQAFRPMRRSLAREFWNLPEDSIVLCFAAAPLWGERKGLRELIDAVRILGRSDIMVMAIGNGDPHSVVDVPVFYTGHLSDERLMALAYSAGDFFVMPSFQEAFAKTPLEAMACGLPTVAFPCSGTEEVIHGGNGILTSEFTARSLAASLKEAIATSYDRDKIREDIIERFSVEAIAKQHFAAYKDVLSA